MRRESTPEPAAAAARLILRRDSSAANRALDRLLFQWTPLHTLLEVGPIASVGVVVEGQPMTYHAFVFELLPTKAVDDPRCGSRALVSLIAWRELPERAGVRALVAWTPPLGDRAGGQLGPPQLCGNGLHASVAATAYEIVDQRDVPSGREAVAGQLWIGRGDPTAGRPCGGQVDAAWYHQPGVTCSATRYAVDLAATFRSSAPAGEPAVLDSSRIELRTSLVPGLRVAVDCSVSRRFAFVCGGS